MICKDQFTNLLSSSSLIKENNYVNFSSKKIKNTLNSLSLIIQLNVMKNII